MGFRDFLFGRPETFQLVDLLGPARVRGSLDVLTAAAAVIDGPKNEVPNPNSAGWQDEAWRYYDDLGEFRYAVDWRAEMISRVRLRAAKKVPGQDEPEILDKGPAADLVEKLIESSVGGPDQLMRSFATQLGVPGEGWLTGETKDPKTEEWRVRSTAEIRKSRKPDYKWEVLDENAMSGQDVWRTLSNDSLVHRVWEPHPRKFHLADSPARPARKVMQELELINRHIVTLMLSRLASAGLILIPEEIDFPIRPEFQGLYNGLVMEWLEAAKTAIATPGTAAAAIPIPLTGAADYLEKIRFVDFSMKGDEKLLEKRDSALRRLATELDLPAEVLLGMGDVNHWSAWQLEESGVKVHILPTVERICYGLDVGYMWPRLKAAGEYDPSLVMWYDASEIIMRPDRSEQAVEAYDRIELSGTALRRETGFDESDKPSEEEVKYQILLMLAKDPANALTALKALTGETLEPVANTPDTGNAQESPEATGTSQGPPDTQNAPPPPPDQQEAAMGRTLRAQIREAKALKAASRHWFMKDLAGHRIVHPADCAAIGVHCPYEEAQFPSVLPGSSGTYEVHLIEGRLRIGARRQDSPYARRGT